MAIGASYLLMGLVVSSYGPMLEHVTHRFGVSLPLAGSIISVHFAASLIGVFVAMRSLTRRNGRVTVMIATAVVGAGLAGAGLAPSWPIFLAGVAVIGVGFGALVIGLNQLVAYSEGRRRAALLNGLNGAYSAGAVLGPILIAALARDHFSLLFLSGTAAALVLVPGGAAIEGRLPVTAGAPRRPSLLVGVFIFAFVLYVGVENGVGGWMAAHLESSGLTETTAATATSGFWLALAAGRLLITLVPPHVPEPVIVLTGSLVAAVSLLAATIGPIAPVAYAVTGLAIAPIFPTGIVWVARLRPGDAGATAWLYPAASVGGAAGPGAIGLVVAAYGVRWAPVVLALVAILMTAAFFVATRLRR